MTTSLSRRRALQLASSAALAPLSGCGPQAKPPPPSEAKDGGADAAFSALGAQWIEAASKAEPVFASSLGNHRYDAELNDVSATGRAARAAVRKEAATALQAIDRSKLSRDNQVDAAMLAVELDRQAFDDDQLQAYAWDPLVYSSLAGDALYLLTARDFAPLPERLLSAAARLEKLPHLLMDARQQLEPARVPRIHAETYGRQNGGAISIIDDLILPHAGALPPSDQKRLKDAAAAAKTAVADQQKWIDGTLTPNAKGDFRIGAAHFDAKLKLALSAGTPRDQLRASAQASVDELRAEMYDIAKTVLAAKKSGPAIPAQPTAEQKQRAIAAAFAIATADRPPREAVFERASAALQANTEFVRRHDLITLPDAPVKVIAMPKFQQGVAVAYCDSPGPLDRKMDTFYAVSPIPQSWSEAQTQSFLKEYCTRAIDELTIHEAMPGHYVQLWHANQHKSVLRAVLGSGSFIEGWGCYAEDMMSEVRDAGDQADPLRRLINLKWALRSVSNAILDQGVHVDGWDEKQAMAFMTGVAFQEEREAAGKWTRARVSSTQLSTYFVGWSEHHALRKAWQAKAGAAFSLKAYHDLALSFGSPPVRHVRSLMFDEPIAA